MPEEESKLRIIIETVLDKEGAKAAAEAIEKISSGAKTEKKEVAGTVSELTRLKEASAALSSVGIRLTAMGAAIGGPIVAATKNYVQQAGMAESTSRRWMASTFQLEQSYIRIGRVGAQAILPWLEKAATFSEKAATWVEKNPGTVKVALGVGGTLFAVGTIATLIGQIGNAITGIQKLGSIFGIGTAASGAAKGIGALFAGSSAGSMGTTTAAAAAGGSAAAGIAGTIASVLAGLLLGGGVNDALVRSGAYGDKGVESNKALTVLAYEIGLLVEKLGGKEGMALSWAGNVGRATGAIKTGSKTSATEAATEGSSFTSTDILQKMRALDIQNKYAQIDYQRSVYTATRDFNRQMTYAEEDFYRQRTRSFRDFAIQQQFAEINFYRQRAIAARDFYISVSRNEYDYQLSRKRAAEDHNFELKQIMLSGDALQYYYSQRQYNIDKQRAEEDYQLQRRRSYEDFSRQQADSATQFAIERAQAKKEFTIRMNDAAIDFAIQRKRQQEEFAIRLKDMEYEYRKERQRRLESFREEILPLIQTEADYRITIEKNLTSAMVANYNALMYQFAKDWAGFKASAASSSTGVPSHDVGGYTRDGLARLHQNEFVLTAPTTKIVEQAAKGSLTQEKIVNLLAGAGNAGMVYNDNRQFSRGLTAEEKNRLRMETKRMLLDAFS